MGVPSDKRGSHLYRRALRREFLLRLTLHTRLALLSLVLCVVLVAGARHASAATRQHKAVKLHQKTAKLQSRALVLGARAVKIARKQLGVPYRWGGTSPRSGFDCSGLVRFVYEHLGISLPHSSYAQFDRGRRVARRWLKPGDLVFFDGVGHVGIYVGSGRFIHAPHSGTRVSIDRLSGWYGARYDGARRLA
jgi:cell wall-associated NlpC family hydrolase